MTTTAQSATKQSATKHQRVRSWLSVFAALAGLIVLMVVSAIAVASASDTGSISVGTIKQMMSPPATAPVKIRDQFGGSGALAGRSLEIDGGGGWSQTDAPAWANASGWRIDGAAAQRNSGTGTSFARTPWLNRTTSVQAEFTTMPTGNNLGAIKYGVGMLGSATSTDALVAVVFRDGNGSNGRFYLQIATISGGTFTSRAGPVAVTSNQSTVPTGTALKLSYNAANRQASASFNSQLLTYTLPQTAPFTAGTSAGLVAVGQSSDYRLDNFQADYPPQDSATITATPVITSDWGTGFHVVVTVSTNSATPVPWTAEIDLSTYPLNAQSVSDVSNATWSFANSVLTASGVGWNNDVSSSTPRTFEFNATRPPAPPQPAQYSYVIDNDWGGGYCATINITTTSATPITWQVAVDMSKAPLNGTPGTPWNAQASYNSGTKILTASGDGWNSEITNTTPASFGFCATR